MQLVIEVVFTAGHFHGEEWPPSPARLFQALVASTHRGAYALFNGTVRDEALRWLEWLDPPAVLACPAKRGRERLVNYVPNNDDKIEHVRTDKSLAVHALAGNRSVLYRWNFAEGANAESHADTVCAMTSLITYLGRTVDNVYARARVQHNSKKVHQDGQVLYIPRIQTGGHWFAPAPGFLELCKRRYPHSVSDEPPDFTNSRQVEYETETALRDNAPLAVFSMLRADGRMLAFDPRNLRQPVGMFRHAMQCWADENPAMRSHYGADRFAQLLFGHRSATNKSPGEGGHFAIVPLPSMNAGFTADGWLRRLLLIGHGCREQSDRDLFEEIARGLNGASLEDNGRTTATLRTLGSSAAEQVLSPWMDAPKAATTWRSVTPIILTGLTRKGRDAEDCLVRAIKQQGFGESDLASVAAFTGPLVPRSQPARAYRVQGYLTTTQRTHAEIVFRRPASGPLVIGRGRFVGFGLMFPWKA
jgi:CRISPR-associated protein Csb2